MTPCEQAMWKVLPAIKARLAQEMLSLGMKGSDVAKVLGTTKAAVSQYAKGRRGSGLEIKGKALEEIKRFARKAAARKVDDEERMRTLCRICRSLRMVG